METATPPSAKPEAPAPAGRPNARATAVGVLGALVATAAISITRDIGAILQNMPASADPALRYIVLYLLFAGVVITAAAAIATVVRVREIRRPLPVTAALENPGQHT